MTADLKGQRRIDANFVAAPPLPNGAINHLVGTTATVITKPGKEQLLVLLCEVSDFRVASGDRTATGSNDMPSGVPASSKTDGSGSWFMKAGDKLVIDMPGTSAKYTLLGSAATSVMTYYWV